MAAGPPVSFASPEPLAGLRTDPGGQVPGLHLEPKGRGTSSWSAPCKKLDAPGLTCPRRVCWHGLSVSSSILMGDVLSVPPSVGF